MEMIRSLGLGTACGIIISLLNHLTMTPAILMYFGWFMSRVSFDDIFFLFLRLVGVFVRIVAVKFKKNFGSTSFKHFEISENQKYDQEHKDVKIKILGFNVLKIFKKEKIEEFVEKVSDKLSIWKFIGYITANKVSGTLILGSVILFVIPFIAQIPEFQYSTVWRIFFVFLTSHSFLVQFFKKIVFNSSFSKRFSNRKGNFGTFQGIFSRNG